MIPFSQGIADRAVGEQFPLSIATELAIESACGIHPEIKVRSAPILEFGEFWVNCRTLFRNFMGALEPDVARGVLPVHIAQTLITEMDTIEHAIEHYSSGRCKVVFYLSNYKDMERHYRHARVRADNTDKQKSYRATMNSTMENLLQMIPERIRGFDLHIGGREQHNTVALILTNYAFDLVSHDKFKDLVLLESHTGNIKERAQWYTKYHNGKELSMMPFREDLLQIFGDSETFAPLDIKLRKSLIDIAVTKRWSATTTTDKIRSNIKEMPNQFAAGLVRQVMSS